jgi:hypothetical protein
MMQLLPNRNVTVHSWHMRLLAIAVPGMLVHSLRAFVGQEAAELFLAGSGQS